MFNIDIGLKSLSSLAFLHFGKGITFACLREREKEKQKYTQRQRDVKKERERERESERERK